jgi:putative ABC transport system substrate-binding protein
MGIGFLYSEPLRIAILKSRDIEPYNTAMASFEKTLKDNGYDVQFFYYDLKGILEDGARISRDIVDANPALILTLGTEATRVAKENIEEIPVVFSMVLDPVGNGFVDNMERSGTNIAGVALDIPIELQFETFVSVLPKAHKIGVIYDPQKSGRYVEEADLVARKMGLELVKVSVSSGSNVPEAIEKLRDKIDGLWATVDNTVYTPQSTQYILLFTLRHKIPFMAFSDKFVKAGAMIGLRGDYRLQGRDAARIAINILNGKEPSRMPVILSEKCYIFLNKKVADMVGVEFSPEMMRKAQEIF